VGANPLSELKHKIDTELDAGAQALASGNAGRARVHARRAASWAVGAYMQQRDLAPGAKRGFEQLLFLRDSGLVSARNQQRLQHLTISLEKDDPEGESYWPLDVNLLDEARILADELLGDLSADSI